MYKLISDIHDYVLLYRDFLALLLMPCALMAWVKQSPGIVAVANGTRNIALGLAALVTALTIWTSIRYLVVPGYFDHVEASVVAISWWFHRGHQLYPAWEQDEGIYGLLYGPLLYQITAIALSVSPTILMSKIPGFCSFWLAGFAIAWALPSLWPSPRQSILVVATCLTITATYSVIPHWVRAEPYLLLLTALAMLTQRRLSTNAAAVAIGLLVGATFNLKIHAVLYLAPYAVAILDKPGSSWSTRLRTVAIGVVSSLPAIALPFLDTNISVFGYIGYIQIALGHELDGPLVMANLRFAGVLAMPFMVLAWRHVRGDPQPDILMGLAFVGSLVTMCVLAGKQLGSHHLLPFLPCFAWFLVRVLQTKPTMGNNRGLANGLAVCFLVLLVSYMPAATMSLNDFRYVEGHMEDDREALAELTRLYEEYPNAVMGIGDNASYRLTYYRVVGIFAVAPIGMDFAAWMDLKLGGVSDKPVERLLINCRVPVWIIPKGGALFTARESNQGKPMFSDWFRRQFLEEYKLICDGVYFSVWRCLGDGAMAIRGSGLKP